MEHLLFWLPINVIGWIIVLKEFVDNDIGCSFVNPKALYKHIKVNWFGAWFLAIIANILLPAIAIPYWIYKVCTVGREK